MRLITAFLALAAPAAAEVPQVVTDIAPVHSLVAQVMGDLGTPSMVIPPGTSFHDAGLRPSDAAALAGADLVIWTGAGAVPFLADPVSTLAPDAVVLALLDSPGWEALPLREGGDFDDGHDHGHAHDHAHDHDHDHGHSHGHGEDGLDPHAWLDPAVARAWIGTIADTLAAADPEHADLYRANAEAAAAEIAGLRDEIAAMFAPVARRPWLAAHDAYQYFEHAFDIPAAGAVALSDAAGPGPARIAALRDRIASEGIACIIAEPDSSPRLVALLSEGQEMRIVTADPDGLALEPGPALYADLVTGIAEALSECLQ